MRKTLLVVFFQPSSYLTVRMSLLSREILCRDPCTPSACTSQQHASVVKAQLHPGLHQKQHGHQARGSNCSSLFSTCETIWSSVPSFALSL